MRLPGRLDPETLGDVLGTLHRAGASGVLELVEGQGAHAGRCHRIFLSRGLVQHVSSALSVPRIGELLQGKGFLDASARGSLLRALLAPAPKRTGEILAHQGRVPPAAVSAALRQQLQLKLTALFELSGAQLRFRVAVRPPDQPLTEIPLSPREFLHGRKRRRDDGATGRPPAAPAQRARRACALRVLGLAEGATSADIQRAFRARAREFHPDRHPGVSEGERVELLRRFSELSAAYHQLCA